MRSVLSVRVLFNVRIDGSTGEVSGLAASETPLGPTKVECELIANCSAAARGLTCHRCPCSGCADMGSLHLFKVKSKGCKYHYSRYLVGIWAPKVYTILYRLYYYLDPLGRASGQANRA